MPAAISGKCISTAVTLSVSEPHKAYLDSMMGAIERIPDWPLAARERDEVRPPVRLLPHGSHHIFYDIVEDKEEIQILRVMHRNADWITLL